MSLLKVLIVKCDDGHSIFKRLRTCIFETGDMEELDRMLGGLEESNNATLNDLQDEIGNGINILEMVSQLSEQLQKEQAGHDVLYKKKGNRKSVSPQRARPDGLGTSSEDQIYELEIKANKMRNEL